MKKLISIFLCINILSGCGGVRALRRQSTTHLHKTVKEDSGIYYNDKIGHNTGVEIAIHNKYDATIFIPVKYSEYIEKISSKQMPAATKKVWDKLDTTPNADLKSYWEIPVKYNKPDKEFCITSSFILVELLPIFMLVAMFSKNFKLSDAFSSCFAELQNELLDNRNISSEARETQTLRAVGINKYMSVQPRPHAISCDKKACGIIDRNGTFINEIKIHKNISFDHQKLKELLQKEKEEKIYRENLIRKQDKDCPGLHILANNQRDLDPLTQMQVAKDYVQLRCNEWFQRQIYR